MSITTLVGAFRRALQRVFSGLELGRGAHLRGDMRNQQDCPRGPVLSQGGGRAFRCRQSRGEGAVVPAKCLFPAKDSDGLSDGHSQTFGRGIEVRSRTADGCLPSEIDQFQRKHAGASQTRHSGSQYRVR